MVTRQDVARWGKARTLPGLLDRGYLRKGKNPVLAAITYDTNQQAGTLFFACIMFLVIAVAAAGVDRQTHLLPVLFGAMSATCLVIGLITGRERVSLDGLDEFRTHLQKWEAWRKSPLQQLFDMHPSDDKLREIGHDDLAEVLVKSQESEGVFEKSAALQEFRERHATLAALGMVNEDEQECLKAVRKRMRKAQAAA